MVIHFFNRKKILLTLQLVHPDALQELDDRILHRLKTDCKQTLIEESITDLVISGELPMKLLRNEKF